MVMHFEYPIHLGIAYLFLIGLESDRRGVRWEMRTRGVDLDGALLDVHGATGATVRLLQGLWRDGPHTRPERAPGPAKGSFVADIRLVESCFRPMPGQNRTFWDS